MPNQVLPSGKMLSCAELVMFFVFVIVILLARSFLLITLSPNQVLPNGKMLSCADLVMFSAFVQWVKQVENHLIHKKGG